MIYDVSPREFEEIVEQVLKDEGIHTHRTQPTRDGGRDIIATKQASTVNLLCSM